MLSAAQISIEKCENSSITILNNQIMPSMKNGRLYVSLVLGTHPLTQILKKGIISP